MNKDITIGEKYGPAMKITDPAEASCYFEECVEHTLSFGEVNREAAERIEKANLGYFAGYYDNDTRKRVEKLFCCAHPVFGPIVEHKPTTAEALRAGMKKALEHLPPKERTKILLKGGI